MDASEITELFASLGPVSIRRMFGGKGIYHQGLIIAVEFQGDILLKADAHSAPQFAAAGATQWTYEGKSGAPVAMPYWSIPAEAFDESAIMAHWLRLAAEAARRAAKPKPPRKARA